MSKMFYVAKNSAKYIIKANPENGLYKNNAVIAHCYPNKKGFLVYLHENALNISVKSYEDNKRYIEKAKNEHFAKKFTIVVNRENAKTEKQRESLDKKTVENLVNEFESRANAIIVKNAKKADKKNADKKNAENSPA